jgi:hypothetical protein
MIAWLLGVVACLGLLAGCGGFKGSLMQGGPQPSGALTEVDESSGEGLSAGYLEKSDVPIHVNKQVKAYLTYFSTERKAVVNRWLARSTRYLPMIKEIFQEYGLPEDLAYLAMIESGFNPNAGSPAGAVGMWQFIKGTGVRYGLVIDGSVDERRDPVKSTRAAARYLTDLYKQFGSWYLAAASYNCGEHRVQKELRKSSHRNFWELSANRCLPSETKNYVPQLIAATIIAKNPEKYGFNHVPYQAPQAPEVQLAQASNKASRGSSNGVAACGVMPLPLRAKGAADPQPQGQPSCQAPGAPQADRQLRTGARNPKKPATQAAYASDNRRNAAPCVASLFGSSSAVSKKGKAEKPKSPRSGPVFAQKKKSPQKSIGKGKGHSPTRLAKHGKPETAKAKSRQKSAANGKNGKPAKTRQKTLLAAKT